jgi:hypothetical protein
MPIGRKKLANGLGRHALGIEPRSRDVGSEPPSNGATTIYLHVDDCNRNNILLGHVFLGQRYMLLLGNIQVCA